jgi:hypothetical protein
VDVLLPVLLLAAAVAFVVLVPLRSPSAARDDVADLRADLEAQKESKYREIKDAELDFRMGKLSEEDWRSLDRELRAHAIEILKQLDRFPGNGQRATSN